jgi:hypothetical protein
MLAALFLELVLQLARVRLPQAMLMVAVYKALVTHTCYLKC